MNFAIIAAGEGSRLQQEGISIPKPLIKLNNVPMIERLISIFLQNNAKSISIITNTLYPEIKTFLEQLNLPVPLHVVYKTTPSSLHSFYELIPYLKNDSFCLTTVDTLFDSKEFSSYLQTFQSNLQIDGLMAVTSHVDDESPLFVKTDNDLNITAFLDSNKDDCQFISGGIYCLKPSSLEILRKAYNNQVCRMRNLQREFLNEKICLKAYQFSKILDIDHASDIPKAEAFLSSLKKQY